MDVQPFVGKQHEKFTYRHLHHNNELTLYTKWLYAYILQELSVLRGNSQRIKAVTRERNPLNKQQTLKLNLLIKA